MPWTSRSPPAWPTRGGPTASSPRSPAPPAAAAASWPAGGPNGAAPRCGATSPAPTDTACGATPAAQGTDFFLEYDTGSEDLPRLAAKLTGYRELANRTQIATPVLFWLASGPRREQQFRALLAAAGPVPGVPVATATPAPAQAGGGPAAAAWLPAWQSGPRLRLGQVTAAVPGARPAAQPPAGDTGLGWHPPVPHPPPAAGFGSASQASKGAS